MPGSYGWREYRTDDRPEVIYAYYERLARQNGWSLSPVKSAEGMATGAVQHIVLPVGDLGRAADFYCRLLGFQPVTDYDTFMLLTNGHVTLTLRPRADGESPWGYSPRFEALMRFQAERAHATFDAALARLPASDRQAQKPGLMMANIYRTLLREIESQGFQVLHQRTSLTPLRKLWIAARTHVLAR